MLARFDNTGDRVKNVMLHLTTNRNVSFYVGNDLFPGSILVNKVRGNRDKQYHQRKQREERIEGERSRPLCPVNPQKLFRGKKEYGPNPMGLFVKLAWHIHLVQSFLGRIGMPPLIPSA
jgi:hypothetical protein